MHWVRSHSRLGSCLALSALALQLALSFGHIHLKDSCGEASTAIEASTDEPSSDEHSDALPADREHHEHEDEYCAIYAINGLLGSAQNTEPPALPLPLFLSRVRLSAGYEARLADGVTSFPKPAPLRSSDTLRCCRHHCCVRARRADKPCAVHAAALTTTAAQLEAGRRSFPESHVWGVKMSIRISRLLLLSSSAFISLHCLGEGARAQTTDAAGGQGDRAEPDRAAGTAPGRVRVRPPLARQLRPPTPTPTPTVTEPAQLQGTLPIVTDQFATVTVIPRGEIQRSPAQNLGDVMFSKPGITSTTTSRPAPAAPSSAARTISVSASRRTASPAGDVSDTGEDHPVTIDPLIARPDRGDPRTGDAALGLAGDRRRRQRGEQPHSHLDSAPRRPPRHEGRPAPRSTMVVEGAVLLDAGKGNFAFHADAFGRRGDDYRIPSYPYLFPPDPAPFVNGTQPNSSLRTSGQSVGGSYLFDGGFVGVAVSHFDTLYRLPGIEPTETGTRIDAHQTKVDQQGRVSPAIHRHRRDPVLARRQRLQARRACVRERLRRRPADLHQQDRRRVGSRSSWHRSICASPRSPPRSACRPAT